ncbi:MAG: flagellar brake protein [Gammaproteobacteria bacterium]|nr:flagellar brake protein [Gammaproteobacteria bacterium]
MTSEFEQVNDNNTNEKELVDNYDKYLLHNRAAIIQKLKQLAKGKNNITAHFAEGKYTLLTQVVDVLNDKGLVVLDYGSNEKTNKQIINAQRIIFKTQHEGITAQFNASKVQKAKFQNKPAFACAIPDALLWVQRREFYRVRIPLGDHIKCQLIHDQDIIIEYPVLDISIAGMALHMKELDLEFTLQPGMIFNHARLLLPDSEVGVVNLEIVNQMPMKNDNPDAGERFGCQFIDISGDTSAMIQRYIYNIEQLSRRTLDSD